MVRQKYKKNQFKIRQNPTQSDKIRQNPAKSDTIRPKTAQSDKVFFFSKYI